jgi:hypothetical protein
LGQNDLGAGRACSALKVGRECREDKPMKVGRGSQEDRPATVKVGSRSFAEVVGTSKAMEEKKEKGLLVSSEAIDEGGPSSLGISVSENPGREMAPAKTQLLSKKAFVSVALGGRNQTVQGLNRELEEVGAVHPGSDLPATKQKAGDVNIQVSTAEEACQGKKSKLKGRKESPFNAKQELGNLREWLCQLRGEVEAGLVRVDRVLNKLETVGPGQVKKNNVWIPKPKRKIWHKKKQLDSGPSPKEGKSFFKPREHLDDGVGSSDGVGYSKGLIPKPNLKLLAGIEKEAGLGPYPVGLKKVVEGQSGVMGLEEGPDLPGPVSSYAGDKENAGEDEISSKKHFASGCSGVERVSMVEETQREGGFQSAHSDLTQKMPIGEAVSSGTQCVVPVRGSGALCADKNSQKRPVSSWVAGRTGFGPVNVEKTKGMNDLVAFPETRGDTSVLEDPEQVELFPVVDRIEEDALAGADASVQVDNSKDLSAVYRRRDVLSQGSAKGFESGRGVGSEGGMEELALEVVARDAGSGLVNDELEDPSVKKNMKRTLEVSTVAGLSCDGQEGKKEECLRQIVIEKHEMGRGEGSVSSEFQQEEDSQGSDWGNCSDYEA